jgi:hypothetical protein
LRFSEISVLRHLCCRTGAQRRTRRAGTARRRLEGPGFKGERWRKPELELEDTLNGELELLGGVQGNLDSKSGGRVNGGGKPELELEDALNGELELLGGLDEFKLGPADELELLGGVRGNLDSKVNGGGELELELEDELNGELELDGILLPKNLINMELAGTFGLHTDTVGTVEATIRSFVSHPAFPQMFSKFSKTHPIASPSCFRW